MIFLFFLLLLSCSTNSDPKPLKLEAATPIARQHDEYRWVQKEPEKLPLPNYPWEAKALEAIPRISKEYFRCKGSSLNPPRQIQIDGVSVRIQDCSKHSLPLRDNQEFIYAILIDLLNYLQLKTGKCVVITSGHCCPEHSQYSNSTDRIRCNKHMLGAAVSFYVQGMEDSPQAIVNLLQEYYKINRKYAGKKEYQEFQKV